MKNAGKQSKKLFDYIDFKQIFFSATDNLLRRVVESLLVFILGGVAGAAIVAARLDPRVLAVEIKNANQDGDIGKIIQKLDSLSDSDIENQTQIRMLILYQIPTTERDALRQEAEKQLATQKTLQEDPLTEDDK